MSLSEEALRLACRMYTGHTGMSRDELLRFFAARAVDVSKVPETFPARRTAFMHCLGQLDPKGQIEAVRALTRYDGRMRHGRPSQEERERLRSLLG